MTPPAMTVSQAQLREALADAVLERSHREAESAGWRALSSGDDVRTAQYAACREVLVDALSALSSPQGTPLIEAVGTYMVRGYLPTEFNDLRDEVIAAVTGTNGAVRHFNSSPQGARPTCSPALRQLHDAAVGVWGDFENCEDCAARSEAGDSFDDVCSVHSSNALYDAIVAARRELGPCRCGHGVDSHEQEDDTRCRECSCRNFGLPPLPAPSSAPPPAEEDK